MEPITMAAIGLSLGSSVAGWFGNNSRKKAERKAHERNMAAAQTDADWVKKQAAEQAGDLQMSFDRNMSTHTAMSGKGFGFSESNQLVNAENTRLMERDKGRLITAGNQQAKSIMAHAAAGKPVQGNSLFEGIASALNTGANALNTARQWGAFTGQKVAPAAGPSNAGGYTSRNGMYNWDF